MCDSEIATVYVGHIFISSEKIMNNAACIIIVNMLFMNLFYDHAEMG